MERWGFKVVRYGVENTLREVVSISTGRFNSHGGWCVISSAPDFVVFPAQLDEVWLVEVKFRQSWTEETQKELKKRIFDQAKYWHKVNVIIGIKTPFGRSDESESFVRVLPCSVSEGVLHVHTSGQDLTDWDKVSWQNCLKLKDVFKPCENGDLIQSLVIMLQNMPSKEAQTNEDKKKLYEFYKASLKRQQADISTHK